MPLSRRPSLNRKTSRQLQFELNLRSRLQVTGEPLIIVSAILTSTRVVQPFCQTNQPFSQFGRLLVYFFNFPSFASVLQLPLSARDRVSKARLACCCSASFFEMGSS